MKPRRQPYGTKNICGAKVEQLRKERGIKQRALVELLQLQGVDMNPSSLSKLEGQQRIATDIEVRAIANALGVTADFLLSEWESPLA